MYMAGRVKSNERVCVCRLLATHLSLFAFHIIVSLLCLTSLTPTPKIVVPVFTQSNGWRNVDAPHNPRKAPSSLNPRPKASV